MFSRVERLVCTVRDVVKGTLMSICQRAHTLDLWPAAMERCWFLFPALLQIHKLSLFLRHLFGKYRMCSVFMLPPFPLATLQGTQLTGGFRLCLLQMGSEGLLWPGGAEGADLTPAPRPVCAQLSSPDWPVQQGRVEGLCAPWKIDKRVLAGAFCSAPSSFVLLEADNS